MAGIFRDDVRRPNPEAVLSISAGRPSDVTRELAGLYAWSEKGPRTYSLSMMMMELYFETCGTLIRMKHGTREARSMTK
jgi:hypothetical protein